MRGIDTEVRKSRKRIFKEVANLAYYSTNLTDDMTDMEENLEIERAIDRIIELDFQNIYKKVSRDLTYPEE